MIGKETFSIYNKRGGSFTLRHGSHDLLCISCCLISIRILTSCHAANSTFVCNKRDGFINPSRQEFCHTEHTGPNTSELSIQPSSPFMKHTYRFKD